MHRSEQHSPTKCGSMHPERYLWIPILWLSQCKLLLVCTSRQNGSAYHISRIVSPCWTRLLALLITASAKSAVFTGFRCRSWTNMAFKFMDERWRPVLLPTGWTFFHFLRAYAYICTHFTSVSSLFHATVSLVCLSFWMTNEMFSRRTLFSQFL